MDMMRIAPDRTQPISPARILRARQRLYSASQALIGRLKRATFSIKRWNPLWDTPATHSQRLAVDRSELSTIKVGPPC